MALLAPQSGRHLGKATLVLDLDHTLVDGEVMRPGLDEFLDKMATLYEVIIFTAAPKDYAQPVISSIDKGRFAFCLFGDSCVTPKPGVKHKLLKDLGRDIKKVVVIDDTAATYKFNEENALPIPAFYRGAEDDQELTSLIPFLTSIAQLDDLQVALCERKGFSTTRKNKTHIVVKKEVKTKRK